VGGVIGWCLLIAARGHPPACLCRAVHYHLIVGGVLGGDATWLLKHALEEVVLSALPWTLPTLIGHRAWAILAVATVGPRM
jgi:hypothetical protein